MDRSDLEVFTTKAFIAVDDYDSKKFVIFCSKSGRHLGEICFPHPPRELITELFQEDKVVAVHDCPPNFQLVADILRFW